MPAGSQISGQDGIIELLDTDDTPIGEIPCLVNWTLDGAANITERGTKCMLSNDDGGSDSDGEWIKGVVATRSWNASLEFFWQEDQQIPASVKLDPTNNGEKLKVKLYPNTDGSGKVVYEGTAFIENVSVPSETTGDVRCTATLKGDGGLTRNTVSP